MQQLVGDWIKRKSPYYKITTDGTTYKVIAIKGKGC